MARCKRCVEGVPHDFKHGLSGYTNHSCRCEQCRTSLREYNREYNSSERGRAVRRQLASSEARLAEKRNTSHDYYHEHRAAILKTQRLQKAKRCRRFGDRIGRYTMAEDRIVLAEGLSATEKAAALGRSASSVDQRRIRLRKKGIIE